METKVNYTVVGAFVLVLSAGFIIGILWLASGGGFQKKYDLYLALVGESVAGLNLSAPVKYRGVDVGKVRDIRLDPANPEQVRLIFAIERGTPIKEDTEAVLKTQGLTGIAYVELDGGTLNSPPLRAAQGEEYPVIRTKPSLSARLENILTTVLSKLDSTSDSVNKIFSEENLAAVKSSLADIAVLTHTFAARKDTIDAGITNAARTFDNSARLTDQLGPVIERVGKGADSIRKMGDETAAASASASKTIDTVGADIKRFTADTAPDLQRMVGEVSILTVSLRRLIEDTERNPRSLIFGRKPVPDGPGEKSEGVPSK
jgi:phospholipid/cholesterol/gamma-HCH transport system substrate-binding protein